VNNPENWPIRYPNSESAAVRGNGIETQLLGSAVIDYPIKAPTYPAHEVTIINKTWNQTSHGNSIISSGNYTFTYSIQGYGYNTSANCTFIIEPIVRHPDIVEVTLQPDKPYFLQGENITFTGTIMTKNQSLPYPQRITTNIENIDPTEKSNIAGSGHRIEYLNYDKEIPMYPANTTSTFTWTWNETKLSQHTPGRYTLQYEALGDYWGFSVSCNFEIR
jgi:hypothetical protein